MLTGKKRFKDVYIEFLQWIDATRNDMLLKAGVHTVPGKTTFMLLLYKWYMDLYFSSCGLQWIPV